MSRALAAVRLLTRIRQEDPELWNHIQSFTQGAKTMIRLLTELEIDAACDDFLRALGCGNPQPIVTILDAPPSEDDPDWDELTARAQNMFATVGQETALEIVERVRGRMLARMEG